MGAGASSSSGQSKSQIASSLPLPEASSSLFANDSYAYLLAACDASAASAAASTTGAHGGGGGSRKQHGRSTADSAAAAFLTHEQKIARASALLKLIFANPYLLRKFRAFVAEGWVQSQDYIAKVQEVQQSLANASSGKGRRGSSSASGKGSVKKSGSRNQQQHDNSGGSSGGSDESDDSAESEEAPAVRDGYNDDCGGGGSAEEKALLMLSTSSLFFTAEAPVTAQHLIDFCCDVQDFRRIPRCGFQYFHASHIFETYIMYGASKRIPLSMNTFDEVTELIYLRTSADDITPPQLAGPSSAASTALAPSLYSSYTSIFGSSGSTSGNGAGGAGNQSPIPGRISPSEPQGIAPRGPTSNYSNNSSSSGHNRDPCSCIFDAAVDEALDFLVAEVFPAYEKAYPGLGAEDQNSEIANVIEGKVSRIRRSFFSKTTFSSTHPSSSSSSSAMPAADGSGSDLANKSASSSSTGMPTRKYSSSTTIVDRRLSDLGSMLGGTSALYHSILAKIHQDATYQSSFREYMLEQGHGSILSAFYSLNDIKEYISVLVLSKDMDEEIRVLKYLELLHGFYRRHLATVATHKISIAAATLEDFLQLLGCSSRIDTEVLRPLEHNVRDILLKCHIDGYLKSEQFRHIERSGRRSVAVIASQLATMPSASASAVSAASGYSGSVSGTVNGTGAKSDASDDSMVQLKNILHSEYDEVFGGFLRSQGQINFMYFYQSAFRFKEVVFSNDMDRIVASSLVVEKYVARNAIDQVPLPEFIRLRILQSRFQAPQDMFMEAADWVLRYLCTYCWPKFRDEVMRHTKGTTSAPNNPLSHPQGSQTKLPAPLVVLPTKIDVNAAAPPQVESRVPFSQPASSAASGEQKSLASPTAGGAGNSSVSNTIAQKLKGKLFSRGSGKNSSNEAAGSTSARQIDSSSRSSSSEDVSVRLYADTFMDPACRQLYKFSSQQGVPGGAPQFTLKQVIQQPKACGLFKDFLDREGTSQTLLFLMEVEEYRRIPMVDYMLSRARKIFNKFIHHQCIMPIPIAQSTREMISTAMDERNLSQNLFQEAFTEVFSYIENHQFARFMQSKDFSRVVDIMRLEAQMKPRNRKMGRRGSIQLERMTPSSVKNLREILVNQTCTRYFKDFCVRTYCTENLYFWLDAENYCNVPGTDYRRATATKMFKKYVVPGSRLEINVSSSTREEISTRLHTAERDLFKRAQNEVYNMMDGNIVPNFFVSEEYLNMKAFLDGVPAKEGLMALQPPDA